MILLNLYNQQVVFTHTANYIESLNITGKGL
jgi:hypothetical protein